jgi:hypothetical protein
LVVNTHTFSYVISAKIQDELMEKELNLINYRFKHKGGMRIGKNVSRGPLAGKPIRNSLAATEDASLTCKNEWCSNQT